jgi:hypothetical protein
VISGRADRASISPCVSKCGPTSRGLIDLIWNPRHHARNGSFIRRLGAKMVQLPTGSPLPDDRLDVGRSLLACLAPRVVVIPQGRGEGIEQDEGPGPVRVHRREEHGEQPTGPPSDDDGLLRASCIQHGERVCHVLLDRMRLAESVGKPHTAWVPQDQSRER